MKSERWLRWVRLAVVLVLLGASLSTFAVAAAPQTGVWHQDEEPPEQDDDGMTSDFCDAEGGYVHPVGGFPHPVGARLSGDDPDMYEQVMSWFCEDGLGFGQIMLALRTAEVLGIDAGDLLGARMAGKGWGQIWQEAGFIGRGRWVDSPDEDDEEGPEEAESPAQGPPVHAGPPDHAGPKAGEQDDGDDGGPPPWAGPKTTDGPPGQIGKPEEGGPPEHARSRHNRP
ncbi:MAG: hypothetical protein JXC32_02270 [Anaerolineae bacterium]|nr:hypothetical protein [Anaerolineae bacterium]